MKCCGRHFVKFAVSFQSGVKKYFGINWLEKYSENYNVASDRISGPSMLT
jgi:hypothetical protein